VKPGDLVGGRFAIEALIGKGGMGRVFRAVDRASGSRVAMKVLESITTEQMLRFGREIDVLSKLAHPAIVGYRGHGRTESGEMFLAMEWLDGEDLHARLVRGPLAVDETVELGLRMTQALALSHAHGVIHRDLKPSNLFLAGGDPAEVKLIDFGIAKLAGADALTRVGIVLGTVGYFAPEQARGGEPDARSDLFALGAVLYVCLTGAPPFPGDKPMAILAKIVAEDAPRVSWSMPRVPAELDQLVADLLEKDPNRRPRTALEVGAALRSMRDAIAERRSDEIPSKVRARPRDRAVVSDREQQLVALVVTGALVSNTETWAEDGSAIRTMLEPARAVANATLDVLADGSAIATVSIAGDIRERAADAARFAIAVREILREVPVVLATGRVTGAGAIPVGRAIDWACQALDSAPAFAVRTDDGTASLLGARFQIGDDAGGKVLYAEDPAGEMSSLLGSMTRLLGRDSEVADLLARFDRSANKRRAEGVLVMAEPGAGKSRLVHEVLAKLSTNSPRPLVFLGPSHRASASAPYALLRTILASAFHLEPTMSREARSSRVSFALGRVLQPEARDRIAELFGVVLGLRERPDRSVLDARVFGDHIRQGLTEWLSAESAFRPILLSLDDLHFADRVSIGIVDHVLEALESSSIFVLATASPDIRNVLPEVADMGWLAPLSLPPLTKDACVEIARGALGDARPDVLELLAERSTGNAFFLEELVRAARSGRVDGLPLSVSGAVEARLAALAKDERRLLRAASVFGLTFKRSAVLALAGATSEQIDRGLESLVRAELIVQAGRPTGDPVFAFRSALLQSVAYAMLAPDDRRAAHLRAGEWTEEHGNYDPLVLADHYERGGDYERAAHALLHVTHDALLANDAEGAVRYAERGLRIGARGGVRAKLLALEAEAHLWAGRPRESLDRAKEAVQGLPQGSADWCSALGTVANAGSLLMDVDVVGDALERLREAARRSPVAIAAMVLAAASASVLAMPVAAMAIAEAEVALRSATVQPSVWARLHFARAAQFGREGDWSGAVREGKDAVRYYAEARHPRGENSALSNLGYALTELGAYDEAAAVLSRALRDAESMGLGYSIALARHNLGLALALSGRIAEGKREEHRAIEELRALGDPRLLAAAFHALAQIALLDRDPRAAEESARQAASLTVTLPGVRAGALGLLASALVFQGRASEAIAFAEEGMALMHGHGVEASESALRLAHVEALALPRAHPRERAHDRARARVGNRLVAGLRSSRVSCLSARRRRDRAPRDRGDRRRGRCPLRRSLHRGRSLRRRLPRGGGRRSPRRRTSSRRPLRSCSRRCPKHRPAR
jgi:tetratricopeptide (TPR) repeat protein